MDPESLVAQTARMDAAPDPVSWRSSGSAAVGMSTVARAMQTAWARGAGMSVGSSMGAQTAAALSVGAVLPAQAAPGVTVQQLLAAAQQGASTATEAASSARLEPSATAAEAVGAERWSQPGAALDAPITPATELPAGFALAAAQTAPTDAQELALEGAGATPEAGGADADLGETLLGERLTQWVQQQRHSAELVLDRDGQALTVKVQIKGDEAHISFRSDQAETRQWLDASVQQLRDLLRREGLQLGGMSVDVANAGQQGQTGDEPPASGRRRQGAGAAAGGVQAVSAASTPVRRSGAAAGAGALDVFV